MCRLRDDDSDEVPRIKKENFHPDYGADACHIQTAIASIHGKTRALFSTCVIHDAILSRTIVTDTCRIYVSELVL